MSLGVGTLLAAGSACAALLVSPGVRRAMLTQQTALRAYAAAINTRDVLPLEPLLATNLAYSAHWVFEPLETKRAYLDHLSARLRSFERKGVRVYAELATLAHTFPGPCVVLAQDHPDNLVALVRLQLHRGLIARIELCGVVLATAARRSGDWPGIKPIYQINS